MKRSALFVLAGALLLVGGFLGMVISPALAAGSIGQTGESPSSCLTCHQDQYLLYDSGKWYCLCPLQANCVYCHQGNPDSVRVESAHEGLVRDPLQHADEICRPCHGDDYPTYVEEFVGRAGALHTTGGAPHVFRRAQASPDVPVPAVLSGRGSLRPLGYALGAMLVAAFVLGRLRRAR